MVVKIGKLKIGNGLPLVIQSMTNTDTNNIEESVEQCIRIADAGAQIVRLTVQGLKEVENLSRIRRNLFEKGYDFPLVADVHYNPVVAEEAAKVVEKVRINPGNYSDKNIGRKTSFSENEYNEGINNVRERIKPLLAICKERSTAIRIGVNHGSLSDRIMSRYGDTPEGMAESAMEFIRICHGEGFHNLVISMKASNTRIMAYACRLLVQKMNKENMAFPIHLGVTEAGSGNEGRVRSAVGIACLLQQGIGDTIRVSLTEDPEDELPPAIEIANYFSRKKPVNIITTPLNELITSYKKRETYSILNIGGNNLPVVISDQTEIFTQNLTKKHLRIPDYVYSDDITKIKSLKSNQYVLAPANFLFNNPDLDNTYPIGDLKIYHELPISLTKPFFLICPVEELSNEHLSILNENKKTIIVAESKASPDPYRIYSFLAKLDKHNIKSPVILKKIFHLNNHDQLLIRAAGETGLFFLDGLMDGLWLSNTQNKLNLTDLSFDILQASRVRTTTTEYISCPTCGRTQFNIKHILQKVKSNTNHLTGLKIAVMGCIVNGPGEMADADYGYVGSGPGKVSLYRGRQPVMRNIPEHDAIQRLIDLIKADGKWEIKQ